MKGRQIMFNKFKKDKENTAKAKDAENQENKEMKELGEEELGTLSGAGDPFANRPRVSNKNINDTVRKNG